MRRLAGVLAALLGAVLALAGVAMMVVLGPDDRATTGPHEIETSGVAVVTAPRAIAYAGPTVSVLAEVPDDKPVFVGLGNAVDVRDYLGETERLTIERVRVPWRISTRQDPGEPNLRAAPTALDWWIAQSAGLGGASITVRLPDEPVSLAITSVGDSDLEGLRVTTAYDVPGGFLIGGGAAAIGVGALLLGVRTARTAGPWPRRLGRSGTVGTDQDGRASGAEAEEEVVYVLVDDEGHEREISADEAAGLEVVEERVEQVDDVPDEPRGETLEEPTDPAPASGGWRDRVRRGLGNWR